MDHKEQKNINLYLLDHIEKVEVPVFLKTRIDQKIANNISDSISPKWALSMVASFVLILSINLFVMKDNKLNNTDNGQTELSSFGLVSSNSLYD